MSLRIYGNRQLKTLSGQSTRPTSARVREALFNIWQGKIAGCRWLDLCTGTGAMGAEALCRGASFVVGIEQSERACHVIQQNWQQVVQDSQTFQVIRGNVVQRLPKLTGQQFDRIYFDPPYASTLYQPILEAIAHHQLLATTGEMAVEHSPDRALPDAITTLPEPSKLSEPSGLSKTSGATLKSYRQKTYGNTALTFYRQESGLLE